MARNHSKVEKVYKSYEELAEELLPNETPHESEDIADAAALGRELAADSLSTMERALSPERTRRNRRRRSSTAKR